MSVIFLNMHGCAVIGVESKGEEWRFIGTDSKGIKAYYSREGISYPAKESARVRIKNMFAEARERPEGFEDFEYVIQLIEIDCSKKRARPLRTDGYRKDGSTVSDDTMANWVDIASASTGEQLFNIICGGGN